MRKLIASAGVVSPVDRGCRRARERREYLRHYANDER